MNVLRYHPDLHEVHRSFPFSGQTAHLSTRHSGAPGGAELEVGEELDAGLDEDVDGLAEVVEAEELELWIDFWVRSSSSVIAMKSLLLIVIVDYEFFLSSLIFFLKVF